MEMGTLLSLDQLVLGAGGPLPGGLMSLVPGPNPGAVFLPDGAAALVIEGKGGEVPEALLGFRNDLSGLCSNTAAWPHSPGVMMDDGTFAIWELDTTAPGPDGTPGGGGEVLTRRSASRLVLRGSPGAVTTLDLAGREDAWVWEPPPWSPDPTYVYLYDMTLVNLPYSTHPSDPADLMALAALSFGVRPPPGAGGAAVSTGPRLRLARCTLVLPVEEAAELSPAGAGILAVERLELQPAVVLLNCTLLSASAYAALPGAVPLLPQSRVWPPLLLLHGNRTRALAQGPSGLAVAPGLEAALASQERMCGQVPGGATVTFVARRRDDTVSPAGQDPDGGITVGRGEGATGSGARLGSPGSPAAGDVCTVSGYAPELVGGRTFTDLKGVSSRCVLARPLRLRNLVLYNLAPGGSGPPLEGGDAAWANSSLPLWYFSLTRCPEAAAPHMDGAAAASSAAPPAVDCASGAVALAAAPPLYLDPGSGVLVLASARHYGWYGTDVTVTYTLPPDAPPGASLLPYPELRLPYQQELADVNLAASADFVPAAPPARPGSSAPSGRDPVTQPSDSGRLPAPSDGPQHRSSDGRPPWVLPLAVALPVGVGSALLLTVVIAAVVVAARRRRRRASELRNKLGPFGAAGSASGGGGAAHGGFGAGLGGGGGAGVGLALMQRVAARAGANEVSGRQGESCAAPTAADWLYPSAQGSSSAATPQEDGSFLQDVSVYFCELRERLGRCEGVEVDAATEHAPAGGPRDLQAVIRALQLGGGSSDLQVSTVLGRGAFGVVYRGRWRSLPVAVKTMVVTDVEGGKEGRRRQQAVLEAAISLSIAHENLVATYTYLLKPLVQQPISVQVVFDDSCSTPGASGCSQAQVPPVATADGGADAYKLYIVQELCNGGSLRQALANGMAGSVRNGGSSRLLALRLALDVARGVAHVHACRIVHADLKPDNVLLVVADEAGDNQQHTSAALPGAGEDATAPGAPLPCPGSASLATADAVEPAPAPEPILCNSAFSALTAKVADFGLSLPLPEDATHQSKRYQGTPSRMAPEVVTHCRLSPRSDVWSYGTMLIEFYYGCTFEDIAAVYRGILGAQLDPCGALDHQGEYRQLCTFLIEDMLTSPEQDYCRLTAACFSTDPRDRPDFATIVSRLEGILDEAGAARSAPARPR
ncbi:hypothetical protein GPECTOR_38g362 [Gonium pectorale]|uniref:Protein kinase domain-containing protein n=1 Tax=Gonium pectorale TaxID=33097 RepID=A0A150GBB8_GONPE|nr:hypothetical protein GPECTOR_38g362 [Gonium pectorale]|eukprot:KXZ47124.1 hypothetical protein GPECTOR_38g362 [Gonium pectorale]